VTSRRAIPPWQSQDDFKTLYNHHKMVPVKVPTPKHLKERVDMGDWFLRDVLKEGKVLYEEDNR
jgi:hypothetical protein